MIELFICLIKPNDNKTGKQDAHSSKSAISLDYAKDSQKKVANREIFQQKILTSTVISSSNYEKNYETEKLGKICLSDR